MPVIANDKSFSRNEHKKYDAKGKDAVCEMLVAINPNVTVEENDQESAQWKELPPKQWKIWDVKATFPNGEVFTIECEVKHDWGIKWHDVPFRFDTVDFPYRRRDRFKGEYGTHHIIVGGDDRRMFLVSRKILLASPIRYKMCRNRDGEEPFYGVEWKKLGNKVCFFFKESNGWKAYPAGTFS